MIMVLRRWFIPSDQLEEFRERWRVEIKPELERQPGCIRIEIYESSIRGHWVTSVLWREEDSPMRGVQRRSRGFNAFWQDPGFYAGLPSLRPPPQFPRFSASQSGTTLP